MDELASYLALRLDSLRRAIARMVLGVERILGAMMTMIVMIIIWKASVVRCRRLMMCL